MCFQCLKSLSFCIIVLQVQPGRTFLRRLIYRTKGIQQPHFHIRMNKESRLDIAAWLLVIDHLSLSFCIIVLQTRTHRAYQ
jgi:hypothetical protein